MRKTGFGEHRTSNLYSNGMCGCKSTQNKHGRATDPDQSCWRCVFRQLCIPVQVQTTQIKIEFGFHCIATLLKTSHEVQICVKIIFKQNSQNPISSSLLRVPTSVYHRCTQNNEYYAHASFQQVRCAIGPDWKNAKNRFWWTSDFMLTSERHE